LWNELEFAASLVQPARASNLSDACWLIHR
jgi:hypothetical protein